MTRAMAVQLLAPFCFALVEQMPSFTFHVMTRTSVDADLPQAAAAGFH
jgi:hypothetical protein